MRRMSIGCVRGAAAVGLLLTAVLVARAGEPVLVKDILAGSGASSPQELTAVGSTLFFTAEDGVSGRELWKSDGTAAGTVLVKDIVAGSGSSTPQDLTAVGSALYFAADDGMNGRELWKSDGTAAGTVLVADIWLGSGSSGPQHLTAVGSTLFFAANDGTHGGELWKSDGTSAGTALVKDIQPGAGGSFVGWFFTAVGSKLFFAAIDGTHGFELWTSDGTAAGTAMVKDINPGGAWSFPGYYAEGSFTEAVGSTFYFTADDGTNGMELWKSDGTAAGTVLVKDVNPGSAWSYPGSLTAVGTTLYFGATDGTHGGELWKSDGTAAGTILVKDINTGPYGGPQWLTALDSVLYFQMEESGTTGVELYKSDGTAAGTALVKDIYYGRSSSNPTWLTAFASEIYMNAYNGGLNGFELWKSDGTAAGTVVFDLNPGPPWSTPQWLTVAGNTLFFSADDGTHGSELWGLTVPGEGTAVTPAGQDVVVQPEVTLPDGSTTTVSLDFESVADGGTTSVTTSSNGPPLPQGFKLGSPPVYYDIQTTATFEGSIEICFTWTEGTFNNEGNIVIWHLVDGTWAKLDTTIDTVNNIACGTATSLSPFVVAEVEYAFGGFLQPVNEDGSSIFKAGRTVPLKFQVFDGDGTVAADVRAELQLTRISTEILGSEEEADVDASGAANEGNLFRYDADAHVYIYNLTTKHLAAGTYRARVHLDDGSIGTVDFSLR